MGPAQIDSAVTSIEIDQSSRARDRRLRGHRDRLVLLRRPRAAVREQPQPVAAVERVFRDHADLVLREGLARVELQRRRVDALRIARELHPRQAERVLRERQVDAVGDQGQRGAAGERERELRVRQVATCGAVVARAVGLEVAGADDVVDAGRGPARLEPHPQRRIGPDRERRDDARRSAAALGEGLHDTARRVAVQRGERPAQYLDAIDRAEVDVRQLALPVRLRRRNAVDVQPHAADAEARPRTEAADRQLQVLRVVLAVLQREPRHPAEALGQVDLQAAGADVGAVDPVDRSGHIERIGRDARGGHDDGIAALDLRAGLRGHAEHGHDDRGSQRTGQRRRTGHGDFQWVMRSRTDKALHNPGA